jgi:hypothetical protein
MTLPLLTPDWQPFPGIEARISTRAGGVSAGSFASANLSLQPGEAAAAVAENRRRLQQALPGEPLWLRQVHGITVYDADRAGPDRTADAAVTRRAGKVLAILTADCLPVLLAGADGTLAIAHAGWRGLAAGVLEATVGAMQTDPGCVHAWLGPAIGQAAFEVGPEVRAAFVSHDAGASEAFVPGAGDRWHADLCALARRRLVAAGVRNVVGGGFCTWSDGRFFSHRRDRVTGRFASLLWRT